MSIIDSIKNIFSSEKPIEAANNETDIQVTDQINNPFTCHYCGYMFELNDKDKFSVSVPKLHSDYFFQGVGVQCPECKKTCICG
jgi:hypothetical protein